MQILFCSCSPYHQSSSICLCLHFSQFELCVLVFADGFATLFSFLNIFQCFVNSALSDTYGLSTDTDTTAAQCCHSDLVALAFFAQQVFSGNLNVFINNFACLLYTSQTYISPSLKKLKALVQFWKVCLQTKLLKLSWTNWKLSSSSNLFRRRSGY